LKLTNAAVDLLKLDGKADAIFFDDELKGFGFRKRIAADGRERTNWVAQYKNSSGSTRRITVGSYPLLGQTDARKKAKVLLGRVAKGEDPQAERHERRDKNKLTLGKLVTSFLAAKGAKWKPRTLAESTRYLTDPRYSGPLLPKPLDAIALRDVAARIEVIQHESGDAAAKKWRSTVSAFFV
jgi:hypothetical protein